MGDVPLIIVAHESDTIREAVRRLFDGVGYRVRAVSDGRAAVEMLTLKPALLVIDVALPHLHAYEVVEVAKRANPETRVVLVASIYNRTGYKRRPTSLYGADDYVEQHHIADSLLGKVERLIGPPPLPQRLPSADSVAPDEERIRDAGVGRLEVVAASPSEPSRGEPSRGMVERAQRLARLIVADILLYNGDALQNGEHLEDNDELEARLRLDLEEGRLLFDLRVPEEVRRTRDFIGEALAEIRHKRRAGGLE